MTQPETATMTKQPSNDNVSNDQLAKGDHLGLSGNVKVIKMLSRYLSEQLPPKGQPLSPRDPPTLETVIFSDFVIKINKRDKEQTRVLLITNRAIYNLKPNDYGTCKRRIILSSLTALSCSAISEEFVLHVPEEYDYRYKSSKREQILDLVCKLYKNFTLTLSTSKTIQVNDSKKLPVFWINSSTLKERALTKQMAKVQTREDIMRRKYMLAAESHESDDEEEQEIKRMVAGGSGKVLKSHASSNNSSTISNDKPQAQQAQPQRPTSAQQLQQQQQQLQPGVTSLINENGTDSHQTSTVRLEDFELLKVLGRGSFGKVMQVRMKATGQVYAMKILKKRAIIARNQVEHTKAERKILQALSHPFLMTLRYAFQSTEKLYFVLDYYQGGELFFHLKQQRRFAEETAKLYVAEIACALGHLHSLGVIYRDLKPENILLDEYGHTCLTDFGLSKDVTQGANNFNNQAAGPAMTFCGTPEYLAPEIVTGSGHDKAVDWWSLGILLYELTVGLPPFYSSNVNEMYHRIQHGILRFPPFLSDSCKSLIISLLNRDPRKRLGSTSDLLDIQQHPFFRDIEWQKLMAKGYDIPYKPKVRSKEDVSNFDATFTSEPAVDSLTNIVNQTTSQAAAQSNSSAQTSTNPQSAANQQHQAAIAAIQQTGPATGNGTHKNHTVESAEKAFADFTFVSESKA